MGGERSDDDRRRQVLVLRNVSKEFAGVRALDDVTLAAPVRAKCSR